MMTLVFALTCIAVISVVLLTKSDLLSPARFFIILFSGLLAINSLRLSGIQVTWHFYKDFGVIGIFILSFTVSLIFHFFYANTIHMPSLFRISILGIAMGLLFFSFFQAVWEFWFVYLNAAIMALAHRKFKL
jgi:hypothetical protein